MKGIKNMSSGKITTERTATENNEKVRAYRLNRSKSKNNPFLTKSENNPLLDSNRDKYFSMLQGQDQDVEIESEENEDMSNDGGNMSNNGKTKSKGKQKFPSIIDVLKEEVLYWQDKAKYREFLQEFHVPALEEQIAVLQKENEMLKNERDEANKRVNLFLNTFGNEIKNIIGEYSRKVEALEYNSKKEASFRTMWERSSKLEYEKMKLEGEIKGLKSKLKMVEDSRDFYEGNYYDIMGRCTELYNRLLELDPTLREEKDKADSEIVKLIQEGMRLWRKNKDGKDEKYEKSEESEDEVVQDEVDETDNVNLIDEGERDLINAINTLEYNDVLVEVVREEERENEDKE